MGKIDAFNFLSNPALANFDASANDELGWRPRSQSWTPTAVSTLMDSLCPQPNGRPGDQALQRQQLSAAFLAGVAKSQEEFLLKPSQSLVSASILQARALLKNRAADHQSRMWHAFNAGARAARATAAFDEPPPVVATSDLKLFIRQPFTESGEGQQALVSQVLRRIEEQNGKPHGFHYLTGRSAESADTFRTSFEKNTGQAFTPQAFRAHRLHQLSQADAFINIRVGMSESSAFELSYHVFSGACTPVLFLVWKHAPIKTTLLKDLDNLCDVTYLEFEQADDLRAGLSAFFSRCKSRAAAA